MSITLLSEDSLSEPKVSSGCTLRSLYSAVGSVATGRKVLDLPLTSFELRAIFENNQYAVEGERIPNNVDSPCSRLLCTLTLE